MSSTRTSESMIVKPVAQVPFVSVKFYNKTTADQSIYVAVLNMTSHKPHSIQEIRVQEAGSKYIRQILKPNIEESNDRKILNF